MTAKRVLIQICHHVYTSHVDAASSKRQAGYRTVAATGAFQSEDIKPHLEEWAKRWCNRHPQVPLWFSIKAPFANDHQFWLISKVFPAGTDHAGRPRTCVHTIGIDRATLWANYRDFNPTRIPKVWFLHEETRFDSLDGKLKVQVTPPDLKAKAGKNGHPPFPLTPESGQVLQTLIYAPVGLVATGKRAVPEEIQALFDWLPLTYRLRWAVVAEPLDYPALPCQVVADKPPVHPPGNMPILARSWPFSPPLPEFETGIWDHWLFRPSSHQSSKAYSEFYQWFSRLLLGHTPTPEEESWLAVAFQCLRPFNIPGEEGDTRGAAPINPDRAPQLVLGILALGWANQQSTATSLLSGLTRQLIADHNFPSLACIVEYAWAATNTRPGPIPGTLDLEERARVRHQALEESASPHALVLQALWTVFARPRRIAWAVFNDLDLPLPDLRRGATAWKDRRSLLWFNLAFASMDAINTLHQDRSLLAQPGNQESILMMANQMANFLKYRDMFASEHQWLFRDITAPDGPIEKLDDLLKEFERAGVAPNRVRAIRERLSRYHPARKHS